ncbi:MAG: alkaline phosphatase family protein [Candidatus Alcyoniella australis]|nr:alkaline phosphatase family protein [Candidatus Alcyoniella australis]
MTKHNSSRLIIIAGDGMDPRICDRMIAAGELPTLARLCHGKTIARLGTTLPSQSPVAWTTALTGVNPGRHGIFDFLRRDPQNYLPSIGLYDYGPNGFVTRRRAPLVSELLARQGIRSLLLRIPGTFPPPQGAGDVLCGQGTPDLVGAWGRSAVYETGREREAGSVMGVRLLPLKPIDGGFCANIFGPEGHTLELRLDRVSSDGALLRLGGSEIVLARGELSDWLSLQFGSGDDAVHGQIRCLLLLGGPAPRLYCSAVMVDPLEPAFAVSEPAGLSRSLAQSFGRFATLGWAEDTWALIEGLTGFDDFLNEVERNLELIERMTWWAVHESDYRMVFTCFEHTDRVAHLLGHLADPDHPRHDPALAKRYGAELFKAYRRIDAFCGKLLDSMGPQDTLLVISDHGFSPFAWQVNLNSWLAAEGYLTVRDELPHERTLDELFEHTCFLSNVAWQGTSAYNVGLSSIYLNLEGREGGGIVPRGRSSAELLDRISRGLLELRHQGRPVVRRVLRTDRELWGTAMADAPDLTVCFAPGFRTAWQSSLGALSPDVIFDNMGPWASDHCSSDPLDVPGILAANRPISKSDPWLADVGATMAAFFNVEPDEPLDGQDLFAKDR